MYIEDNELRDLFKAECEEHLQNLDEGLLLLEKNPTDQATLDEVFREAHSLKGAGRMVGVIDVETVAHHFENVLGQAKSGKILLSSETIDRLYKGLDAVRKLVKQAVTGEPSGVDVLAVLAQLEGKAEVAEPVSEVQAAPPLEKPAPLPEEIPVQMITKPLVAMPSSDPVNESSAEVSKAEMTQEPGGRYQIDTIRIKPEKLDALMTQSGELTVTKTRIARRLNQVEELLSLWEDWSRDLNATRLLLSDKLRKQRSNTSGSGGENEETLQRFTDKVERMGQMLNTLKRESSEDIARLETIAGKLEDGIRTARLLPMSTIFGLFPRMVRDLARIQGKEIDFTLEGGETTADKRVIEEMKDPLMHLIRNAADHGIEQPALRQKEGKSAIAKIKLRAYQTSTNIMIEVEDDGRGLDLEAIKRMALQKRLFQEEELAAMNTGQLQALIFASGFTTSTFVTDVSGRGVGLDVVRTNVEYLKGNIQVESKFGQGCLFRVSLPITLATTRVLIVSLNKHKYAIPVEFVQKTLQVGDDDVFAIEGRETIILEKNSTSVARLTELLEIRVEENGNGKAGKDKKDVKNKKLPCIILAIGDERLGVLVDELVDEQEIVLKPHSGILKRVRNVSGATILGTGEVCMVLNPQDLMKTIQKRFAPIIHTRQKEEAARKQTVLLVEDSITTRTQEKRILEGAGYEVVTAVDGVDGFNKLGTHKFDAVISDVEMPNMTGLVMTEKIRQDKKYNDLPIILVTSLASEEDKKRGVEVGANAYITKGKFDQQILLDTLVRLI